ncbi:acyltransferase [Paenibacillus sp. N3.4]|uniref:acyltransferase family protein n=1 Tax=Paenibacillus sp. N3.4 TaxID=2603222 RepID=UPI0011CC6BCA|nr:acyltransferase [Paenibacillus sp. N3.4]TXK76898.1 acyltransferase [Paenibacillus sp. N3.4]
MNTNQKTVLQASRGLSAIFVLFFHAAAMFYKYYHYDLFGVSSIGRSGGVDFFFVLTGFLLYHTYGHKIGSKMTVMPYLTNRLIRIYPFYWLITLIVLPVYFFVPSFGYGFETHKDTIFLSMLLLPQAHGPILPVAWSLSYFVLFYILFSVVMALGKKPAYLLASIWLLLTLCNVLHVPVIGHDIQHYFYLNFLFSEINLEFAAGCLMAVWIQGHRSKHYKTLLSSAMLIFIVIWLNNKFLWVPFHSYLLYIIPAIFILLGATSIPEQIRLPHWVLVLQKLGNASYTILLTHLIYISILTKLSKIAHLTDILGNLGTGLLIFMLTIPLCYLSYVLAERPLIAQIRGAQKLRTSQSPTPISQG